MLRRRGGVSCSNTLRKNVHLHSLLLMKEASPAMRGRFRSRRAPIRTENRLLITISFPFRARKTCKLFLHLVNLGGRPGCPHAPPAAASYRTHCLDNSPFFSITHFKVQTSFAARRLNLFFRCSGRRPNWELGLNGNARRRRRRRSGNELD